MNIIVDMDGVLVNLPKGIIKSFRKLRPWADIFTEDDIKNYDIDKSIGIDGITQKILGLPRFFRELEPMPGAIGGMVKLIEKKHNILIVTVLPDNNGQALFDKLGWLEEHIFPFTHLTKDNVVFAYGKKWCKADIMIDDYPKNLLHFNGTRILIDWPYNRDGYGTDKQNNFIRLQPRRDAWNQLHKIVHKKEMVCGYSCI